MPRQTSRDGGHRSVIKDSLDLNLFRSAGQHFTPQQEAMLEFSGQEDPSRQMNQEHAPAYQPPSQQPLQKPENPSQQDKY
jgi:hypothetical protein